MNLGITSKSLNRLEKLAKAFGVDQFDFNYSAIAELFGVDEKKARKMMEGFKERNYIEIEKLGKGMFRAKINWDYINKLKNAKEKKEKVEKTTKERKQSNNKKQNNTKKQAKKQTKEKIKEKSEVKVNDDLSEIKEAVIDDGREMFTIKVNKKPVKVFFDNGGLGWVVAKDVCNVLGINKIGDLLSLVAPEDKLKIIIKNMKGVSNKARYYYVVCDIALEKLANKNKKYRSAINKILKGISRLAQKVTAKSVSADTKDKVEKSGHEEVVETMLVFKNDDFGEVRIILVNDMPYFVGKDVATILGYKRPADAVRKLVDDEDKGVAKMETPGGLQKVTIINESGLYSLILNSKLPSAKKFKRWVTSEVLPSIARHGAYITPDKVQELLQDPDAMIELLQTLKRERAEKERLAQELESNKPYIEFGKAVEVSEGCALVGDWAKAISKEHNVVIGRNKAFEWLRNNGYLMNNNRPYQRYIDRGYFEVTTKTINANEKDVQVFTTYITSKGQVALTKKIISAFKK
jgi:anti-repressor protein